MSNTHSRMVRMGMGTCVLIGLLVSGGIAPAVAQVIPPISDPTPGSTLTTTTVTFTGGDAGQAGEQHWLSVGTSVWDKSIFHQSLGTGHTTTVSGLPTSGTLYVRYFTYTPVAGWDSQAHTYTMAVAGGGGVSGGASTFGWDSILDATNGDSEGCNSSRFTCVLNRQAVRDNETGLVWERSPDTSRASWYQSILNCSSRREIGGRKGWELPMRNQLASLMDTTGTSGLTLPDGHPFQNVQSGSYWTATTNPDFPNFKVDVIFGNGIVGDGLPKGTSLLTWCVRGGQSFDGNTHDTLH